jgi:hypothetical protein
MEPSFPKSPYRFIALTLDLAPGEFILSSHDSLDLRTSDKYTRLIPIAIAEFPSNKNRHKQPLDPNG